VNLLELPFKGLPLQANNYNIKIDTNDEDEGMWMKLLSRQLPHEAMEEFRAPSLQTTHNT